MMECQDVRAMLAFLERKSEELDAGERTALQKHLETCPDCAAMTAAERQADLAIGTVMRAVPVPAGLKQQVLKRLAAGRGSAWKGWTIAVAAALLLAVGGGTWHYWPKPEFLPVIPPVVWKDADEVDSYFAAKGLIIEASPRLKYELLDRVDIELVDGRPVAKLTFLNEGPPRGLANVYIVDTKQFNLNQFNNLKAGNPSMMSFRDSEGSRFIIVIVNPNGGAGGFDWLMKPVQRA
jgi:Putative zinc-finger